MAAIGIIGGGLSGLYAALLLERQGIDYLLLEARSRFGGRITSYPATTHDFADTVGPRPVPNRFDLGATWIWPAIQPHLAKIITDLGLETFPQHEDGDMLIDRFKQR